MATRSSLVTVPFTTRRGRLLPRLCARTAAALAVGTALLAGLSTAPAAAAGSGSGSAPSSGPIVVVGIAGLRWSDIQRDTTPTLYSLIGAGSVASISVRTVNLLTCPVDAWLTLSAGNRATGSPAGASTEQPTSTSNRQTCPRIPPVRNGRVTGWSGLVRLQQPDTGSYGRPGVLGHRLARAGVCGTAVGPGAAVALAGLDGRVRHVSRTVDRKTLGACPVTVVDAGSLPPSPAPRIIALERFDHRVGAIRSRLGPGSRLVIAGIADVAGTRPGLQVVLSWQAGLASNSWLTSDSTRRTGLVQLTDLTATLLNRVGAGTNGLDGAPLLLGPSRNIGIARTIENRIDLSVLTQMLPDLTPWFAGVFAGLLLCVFGLAYLRRGAPQALAWAALCLSAVSVATYLSTLTSWWTGHYPALSLGAELAGIALALGTLASLPPWRQPWAPVVVVAGVTVVVLTVDAAVGTPLQIGSLLGSGLIEGARFFGFGNGTFAVYATCVLLVAGAVADLLVQRGRRALGVVAATSIGVLASLVDGYPTWGADFGGLLSLLPGVFVLALLLAGVRLSPGRVVGIGALVVLAGAAVAAADWLRPVSEQTHLGRFVQRVIDGDATGILTHKADGALATLLNPLGIVGFVAFVFAVLVIRDPSRFRAARLLRAYAAWVTLRETLYAVATTALIGMCVNDSGVVIPVAALLVAAPLVLATCLRETAPP